MTRYEFAALELAAAVARRRFGTAFVTVASSETGWRATDALLAVAFPPVVALPLRLESPTDASDERVLSRAAV